MGGGIGFRHSHKSSFGVVAFVGLVWLLMFGILESEARKLPATLTDSRRHHHQEQHDQPIIIENFKHVEEEVIIRERKLAASSELDLNYMSKRKVPNGPDPIHNRRAGNSRQPPGQQ
ncbi:CLAVATA3/ESR (CLE)-related protein 25 [Malania oleifera]|uniref:CLAVATA3/ESR (CLE)-related protein 25 n=1 Tax=Malania oleifera TaxID=397392 RepID=UPI0025ADC7EA|nr:CLAVATA3/ESR (CLE)-related protein 25 [Malania oleifera]